MSNGSGDNDNEVIFSINRNVIIKFAFKYQEFKRGLIELCLSAENVFLPVVSKTSTLTNMLDFNK